MFVVLDFLPRFVRLFQCFITNVQLTLEKKHVVIFFFFLFLKNFLLFSTFSNLFFLAIIEAGFGKPLEELFVEFDETPLASGAIAQVHKAKIRVIK